MSADLLGRLGLRAAAEGIPASNPDAALLADLAAAADLFHDRSAAFRAWSGPAAKRSGTKAEAKTAFICVADACNAAERRIINAPARTDAAAAAKLHFALTRMGGAAAGGPFALPASAMRDALVILFGCAPPAPPVRRKKRFAGRRLP